MAKWINSIGQAKICLNVLSIKAGNNLRYLNFSQLFSLIPYFYDGAYFLLGYFLSCSTLNPGKPL